ncbi:hypothetical protein AA650_02600 [Anabaena sp. WA102]|jgi:hypothetical protein|nr:hypothetical protein AA650_02600 [Anabaena sp. WA102]OBQ16693.1 MAG: hypothetical protein AN486_17920 [Anabaena sp. AL93]
MLGFLASTQPTDKGIFLAFYGRIGKREKVAKLRIANNSWSFLRVNKLFLVIYFPVDIEGG